MMAREYDDELDYLVMGIWIAVMVLIIVFWGLVAYLLWWLA